MKITAVKGFNDILPEDSPKWQFIEKIARNTFHSYGFSEIRIPIVEKTEVFARSIGEATDIVEKEMYSFPDRNDLSLTLRPEGTAVVVRSFVQNAIYAKKPVNKLYYFGPMFRYERPQKGRYRQFHQIGAEIFGAAEPMADAEIMSMIMRFFTEVGLTGLSLQINSLGCDECRKVYKEKLVEYLTGHKENICDNCTRRLKKNPLRFLDCKAASCNELKTNAPSILDSICGACADHFKSVKNYLDALNTPYEINDQMVRGLDYYSRTTFEVTTNMLGAQNAVAAGGRYDKLCEMFSGPKTPAIGFALGVERLILLLDTSKDYERKTKLFIAALGQEARDFSFKLINQLRAKNISCEMTYSDNSLKSQMRRAGKNESQHVLIIGEDEMKSGSAIIRDMSTKEQTSFSLDDITNKIMEYCS